jgi:hypothetical protein
MFYIIQHNHRRVKQKPSLLLFDQSVIIWYNFKHWCFPFRTINYTFSRMRNDLLKEEKTS